MKKIQIDLFLEISENEEKIIPIDVGLLLGYELNHSHEFIVELKLVFPDSIVVSGKTYNVFNNLYSSPNLTWAGNYGEYKSYLSLKRCFAVFSNEKIEISSIE